MSCPECERRQKEEKKSLEDCNSSLEAMKVKCHRLSLALAVVSAVAGKEALDMAFSLSDKVAAIIEDQGGSGAGVLALDVVVEDPKSLDTTESVPKFEQVDDLFLGIDGDILAVNSLSQPQVSVIEVFEEVHPFSFTGSRFIDVTKSLHSDHVNAPLSTEFSVIPTPTSLPLLGLLAIRGSRARSS
jgi:hypothetical protein